MKRLNSGLQKSLKLSKFCIFSKMLTSAKYFVEFQCFDEKITRSMFSLPKHQSKLNINVRKQKKWNLTILCKYSERYVVKQSAFDKTVIT